MTAIIKPLLLVALAAALPLTAQAQSYQVEPNHTYPSFAANHMGISWFRGKFTKTSGTIEIDRAAKTGSVNIEIDASTVDFGHEKMNKHARAADFFNVEKFPKIVFTGSSMKFDGDTPVAVVGELDMIGSKQPVELKIESFQCRMHPFFKKEVCGADASAVIDRSAWGMKYGLPTSTGEVRLAIQVEALKQ